MILPLHFFKDSTGSFKKQKIKGGKPLSKLPLLPQLISLPSLPLSSLHELILLTVPCKQGNGNPF